MRKSTLTPVDSTRTFTTHAVILKTVSRNSIFADRTSTHAMASNQLRLWLSAFAHLMLSQLQAIALPGTRLDKATIGTLRLRLFKIAARVKISVRRIRLELAEGCSDQDVFAQVFKNLQAWPSQESQHSRLQRKERAGTPWRASSCPQPANERKNPSVQNGYGQPTPSIPIKSATQAYHVHQIHEK